jgi:hypothetical protein
MREADALDAPLLPPPDSDSECSFDSFDSAVRRPAPSMVRTDSEDE